MDDLWKLILAEIEVEVTHGVFTSFFKITTLINIEDDIATVGAPSAMVLDYLEKRYYSLIKRSLDAKTGKNLSIIFTIKAPDKKGGEPKNSGPLFSSVLDRHAPSAKKRPARIKPDYTFETFAVSESNQLAYTAAQAIALTPGDKYNPLYLYGTVGVGKTHLMHAIANQIFEQDSAVSVLYLTTEEFTNEVVEAIRDKTTTNLRHKFRNINLLLLDDVQFLSGKEKVQEELFHTFNALIEKGSQVIFSSDRPPSEIKKLEARLASRFEGGLNIDIEPPDFELRTAILLTKSGKYNMDLSLEMAKMAAEKITDTRALAGFLLRLDSFLIAKNTDTPNKEMMLTLLGKVKESSNVFKPDNVIDTVCDYHNVKPTQLKGKKRDAFLVKPRHICMFLLKEAGLTYSEIGNQLGGRDHTTVMHAVEKMEALLSNSQSANEEIVLIKQKLKDDYLQ